MRLSEQEIGAIISGLDNYINLLSGAELYLFGSRVDDSKKGGDIDLLLVCKEKASADELKFNDYKILAQIKHIRRLATDV